MAIEHYHLRIQADVIAGAQTVEVYQPKTKEEDFNLLDKLESTMVISLGPNDAGQREDVAVNSVTESSPGGAARVYTVSLNSGTIYSYLGQPPSDPGNDYDYRERYGDPASFYRDIWVFNNYDGTDGGSGALYKLNSLTGGIKTWYPGGEYKNIEACTFYAVPNYIFDRAWQLTEPPPPPATGDAYNWPKFNSIAYVRTTNLIFLNPDNFTESYGSMTMDNIFQDQSSTLPIFDLTMEGVNVYRLQTHATYYGTTYEFAGGNFSYQLSTLEPFITSISLRANPAILPANQTNTSEITAIVKDQFNLPIARKEVTFTEDDFVGEITGTNPANTDDDGVAVTRYQAGNTAREVKITATAQQGGVDTPQD